MTDEPTLATLTAQVALLTAEVTALRNQPSLRHCLYPGCIREFDMMARMNGRAPVKPSWSGDGWQQVTRGPAKGYVCPDHAEAVTAHMASTVDLPNGRWTVACACEWMARPQTWPGLLRPLWEEHLLTATGELTAPVTLAETPGQLPVSEHTEATLTELYEALEDAEHELAELYEALEDAEHELAETRDAAQAMFKAWDWHRHTLGGVSRAVTAVCNQMRVNSRDWAAERGDAYLWAVLIGWDDEALEEVAVKHRWDEHRIKYVREMRALLAPITAPPAEQDT